MIVAAGSDGTRVIERAYSAHVEICPECGAGYHRIVLTPCKGVKGEYRCLTCNHVLEVFEGSFEVLIRLTVPSKKKRRRRSIED